MSWGAERIGFCCVRKTEENNGIKIKTDIFYFDIIYNWGIDLYGSAYN